jgi:hypothetical protein
MSLYNSKPRLYRCKVCLHQKHQSAFDWNMCDGRSEICRMCTITGRVLGPREVPPVQKILIRKTPPGYGLVWPWMVVIPQGGQVVSYISYNRFYFPTFESARRYVVKRLRSTV